ncbi:uncharacterized protein Z520_04661 [Fonsecaea multimorphosa CBS 102226]|uniref:Uncharacterized protein n=1 Tax=Fonsecaea multimorphosa CBS 102226 TaxID=1442371 RepID=A0A0D2K2E9_9EURO|nr:uncharacterized protein Z520_04661 [Fonsecaea multimorphosa CBS 102226]KIY00023.1 hypothetical protein Z520_04661 [Fonsecaea multimorphosa CBS 102226]OAL26234.1 hypothetical protein AYO22_04412 [Fonsecaea multimorphosa]
MEPPPPPPPPHGNNPQGGGRSGGLPNGKYDIFVIPPHSAGSGFLYLPSLQTHRNSFLAGVFCTAASFFIYYTAVPVVKEWLYSTINSGGTGVFTLICGVAVVAWAFGKTQSEWQSYPGFNRGSSNSTSGDSGGSGPSGYSNAGSYTHQGHHPNAQSPPPPGATGGPPPPPNHGASSPPPHSSWQKPPPQANTKANTTSAKSSWEKAREETRKREEERKRAEELKRRREELEKERQKQKDELDKERQRQEQLEKERQRQKANLEKELQRQKEELERERQKQKDLLERERLKLREKELLERLERERKEKKEREEKEAAAKAKSEQANRSPPKRPPMPTATTERDDDAYSFRPYDRPKRTHKANSAASMYSESSYAPSESTAKTTPPPSMRGPYSTKDPDKIIIKGVFSFNNAFMRTPISQLISGQGNVTDGLILRITTEGLFIDDDVRGVPQREWDVKAWTMKLAEVWCPDFLSPKNMDACPPKRKISLGFGLNADSRRVLRSPSQDESAAFVSKLLDMCGAVCKNRSQPQSRSCLSHSSPSVNAAGTTRSTTSTDTDSTFTQSCELSGLHVLRASVRDQEGKKYVFILSQSEGWKVAVGLQRLRRGTQVRALGVAGLPMNEAKAILENLGFA